MRQALAARLDDTGNVYWLDAENGLYCKEALRIWQSYTRYWLDSFPFNTAALSSPVDAFYDLTQQSGTLIPFTLMDTDLESELCYNLIEAQPAAGVWQGTDQFTIYDLTNALQRRRDQFLVETGMVLSRTLMTGIIPPVGGRIPLPDNVIDVRRAAWLDTQSSLWNVMWKSDEFTRQALQYSWFTSPGIPSEWSVVATPPVTLQLMSPPLNPGTMELLTVNAGAPLNPAVGVLLGIPDDFAWVIRFGALADLLSQDGQARDPSRAQYCEQRWQEGILAARAYTSVEIAFLDGAPVPVSPLFSLDTMQPTWQNYSGPPASFALAGWNLLALSPIPDNNGPYSVAIDLVRNAPVPSADGDFIQLGREELDAVLDEAEHLAAFKMGGAEFQATMKGHANFRRMALIRNQRLAAVLRSGAQPMFDKGWREERQRVRRDQEIPVGVSLDDPAQIALEGQAQGGQ
jgi:hypothetical protein